MHFIRVDWSLDNVQPIERTSFLSYLWKNPPILKIMDASIIILFIVGFCSMLSLVFNFLRFWIRSFSPNENTENALTGMPYKSIFVFVVSAMLVFVISDVVIIQARGQVINFLGDLDDRSVIKINDTVIENRQEILVELKKVAPLKPHRSHTEGRIAVVIENGDSTLELELGRDSQDTNEYWVFYPKYLTTESNEVGRIISDKFDGFNAVPREYD